MSTQQPTPGFWTFKFQIRKRTVQNTLMVAVAAFLASTLIGLAATTISTNISTDGTLSVTGRATTTASLVVGDTQPGPFNLGTGDLWASAQATTSGNLGVGQGSAGDDDSIFFDADSSEYLAWLNTRALFSLSDDLEVSGNATSTTRLVVGTTNPSGNVGAGDLFVGGSATITGTLAIGTGSSYASTTNLVLGNDGADLTALADLYVSSGNLFFNASRMGVFGDNASWQALWTNTLAPTNTSAGIFVNASSTIAANFRVDGAATTTGRMVVGTTNPSGNVGAGDLFVGGDATTTGSLYVGATASTTTLIVSGSSTTTGNLVIGHSNQAANSTTTVTFGSYEATGSNQGSCLKFRQGTGFIWCYIGGTSGTSLVCSTTVSCETP